MADCLLDVGTCSGHLFIEKLVNEVTDGLLEFATCSGHVSMERLLNDMAYCLLELEHAQVMFVLRGFSMR